MTLSRVRVLPVISTRLKWTSEPWTTWRLMSTRLPASDLRTLGFTSAKA